MDASYFKRTSHSVTLSLVTFSKVAHYGAGRTYAEALAAGLAQIRIYIRQIVCNLNRPKRTDFGAFATSYTGRRTYLAGHSAFIAA